jgi:hypothetical protein
MERPTERKLDWRWQERIGVADKKTLDGDQSVYFNRLMDIGDPIEPYDVANKKYVDDAISSGGGGGDVLMLEHLATYNHGNIHSSDIIDGDTVDVTGRDVDDVLTWNGAAWVPVPICKSNFNGATDPGVGDDIVDGYAVGSNWWNVTDHRLFVAESVATGAAVWRQVYPTIDAPNHNLATAANDFLVASGAGVYVKKTLLETQDILGCRPTGWVVAPALTFSAADAPVYTVTCSGDYTYIIPVGAKIALTHSSSTKYFIVVNVSYSSPNTTFTLYGGTDYTLDAGAITDPYYSIAKAPVGFPLDPTKWTVLLTDSTDRYQSDPVKDTIYNPGSLSISIPIGIWNVSFQAILVCHASSGPYTDIYGGLSTSLVAFDNQALRGRGYLGGPTAGTFLGLLFRSTVLNIVSKTTYYVLCMTDLDNQSVIGFNNASDASLDVRAVCAYL